MVSFDVNMNTGRVIMSFDEPVRALTLLANNLTFVSSDIGSVVSFVLGRSVSSRTTTNGLRIGFTLDGEDLDQLKANSSLFSERNNSFLTFGSPLIQDMRRMAIQFVSAVQARDFTTDNVPPTLTQFTRLSLNDGNLRLSFSEPVDRTSVIPSLIRIQQSRIGGTGIQLSGGIITDFSADRRQLLIALTENDITSLKLQTTLATNAGNSHLSIQAGALKDIAGNNLTVVPSTSAVAVADYVFDSTAPELTGWSLDMDMSTLNLTFNDVMNRDSLTPEHITLHSWANGTDTANNYNLRGGSTTSMDGYVIVVQITNNDLNGIKQRAGLATSRDNSFISINSQLINDQVPLAVTSITPAFAVQATNFTEDITQPRLVAFNISLVTRRLTLDFSETVNITSLRQTGLVLQNQPNTLFAGALMLRLTGGIATPAVAAARFDLELVKADIDGLKQIIGLGSDVNNTYLAIADNAITDMAGNFIVEIPTTNATRVSDHLPDDTLPTLDAVAFDLNSGTLSLTFSETVHALSLITRRVTIRNQQSALGSSRTLEGGVVSSTNSTVVNVTLTARDLNAIKSNPTLATTRNTTFVTLSASAIQDMNANLIDGILDTSAVLVSRFINDTTAPTLSSFDFDPGLSELRLTFSETINAGLFQPNNITLKSNGVGVSFTSVKLSGGTFDSGNNSIAVRLMLDTADINSVKRNTGLGTSSDNTYIAFPPQLVVDMFGNPVEEVTFNASLQVLNFIPDTVAPVLQRFVIDLDQGFIELSFSESVLISSFSPEAITVQSNGTINVTDFRTLTGFARVNSTNGPILKFFLNVADLDYIKSRPNLASGIGNTFISFASSLITDMASRPVSERSNTSALPVLRTGFTGDNTEPRLTGFSLRMNSSNPSKPPLILVLTFSEYVNDKEIIATRFTLQPLQNNTNASQSYQLTASGNVSRISETVLELSIDAVDLAAIRLRQPLAQTISSSYISILAGAIKDAFGNELAAVPASNATQATFSTADLVPPAISRYTLDLNTNQLILTMTEDILANRLAPSRITLQGTETSNMLSVTLSNATLATVSSATVTFSILLSDQNIIKQQDKLAFSMDSTYLSVTRGYVLDIAENEANAITTDRALRVATYIRDSVRPKLDRWDLNLNTRHITLYFDQIVNISTLQTTEFTIQQGRISGGQSYQLKGGRLLTTSFNSSLVFEVLNTDANSIKELTSLAVDNSSAYLVAPSTSIQDMAGEILCIHLFSCS